MVVGLLAIAGVARMMMSPGGEPEVQTAQTDPNAAAPAVEPLAPLSAAPIGAGGATPFAAPATAVAAGSTQCTACNATSADNADERDCGGTRSSWREAPAPAPAPVPAAPEPPKPDPAIAAAAERLDVARAKIASNVLDPALGDLRQIVKDFPGSAAAADASFMTAELLEKMGRLDDAMAAHVEFDNRFPSDKRAAASRLRLAELMLRSKQPNKDNAAREILAKLISAYPGTPQALQGLQMKIRIDGDRRQRELDPVLNVQVPAVLPTLRTLTEQFPTDSSSMAAFNRLAGLYEDIDQYERAAQALTALATNFPNNSVDAWFRAGETVRAAAEGHGEGARRVREESRRARRNTATRSGSCSGSRDQEQEPRRHEVKP